MFSILELEVVIVVLAVIFDALVKLRLTPDELAAASVAEEVNAESQVSKSHDGGLLAQSTPELVAVVADISSSDDTQESNGDVLSSSDPCSEAPEHAAAAAANNVVVQLKPFDDPPLPTGYEYEVFLSFRGPDTRKGFTDCLYHALVGAGVRTFRDDESLRKGEQIGDNLFKAIKESNICIPIFSKNYASSKWCLKELTLMLEEKKKTGSCDMILPVFYDASPGQVKDHTTEGDGYGKALEEHKKKNKSSVEQWKAALREVGGLKGEDLDTSTNGHQGHLIKLIVSTVLKKLKKAHLIVPDKLVEIEDQVQNVKRLLQLGQNDVRIVGIWGMAGMGKTTLARMIYNRILDEHDSFECCSFIGDIRETSRTKGLGYLQGLLVAGLSMYGWAYFNPHGEGVKQLDGRYSTKKVLILLDDVDDTKQLDALVIRCDSFGPGSRIIITTRDKDVLERVERKNIYQIEKMDGDQALKLFCRHAFDQDTPMDELYDVSNDIVRTTRGFPLALEAIGSLLRTEEKTKTNWERKWGKLKEKPIKEVQDRLQISYHALTPAQQAIFLDIACFFIREKKHTAFPMWEACEWSPEKGVDVLVAKSLIKIRDDDTIWMHDQIRDFGREIVRLENYSVPGKRSRLWRGKDAKHTLKYKMGSSRVEAVRCDHNEESLCLEKENFRKLLALRFLELNGANLNRECAFENLLPLLRWLRLPSSSFSSLTNLYQPNLVCLDLPDNGLTDNWDLDEQMMELKVLNLTRSKNLKRPANFSAFPNLERLILSECKGLEGIDESLNKLRNLTYLDISGCDSIEELPHRLGSLTNLEVLDISRCKGINKIPGFIVRMTSLTVLTLDETGITTLGSYVGTLKLLQRLSLRRCTELTELPETIEHLSLLEVLLLEGSSIAVLPVNIARLFHLKTLDLRSCENLVTLPALPGSRQEEDDANLIELNLSFCPNIKALPNLSKLKLLQSLDAQGCTQLKALEGLDQLTALESLNISNCSVITELPDLSNFKSLKMLFARGCSELQKLEGLDQLNMLKKLHISCCKKIDKLPDISKLKRLEELSADGCEQLQGLMGLHELKALKTISVSKCKEIRELPDLSNLHRLEEFYASDCVNLQLLIGLDGLKELRTLDVSRCQGIAALPNLAKLRKLEKFDYAGCEKLEGWLKMIDPKELWGVPYFKQCDLSDTDAELTPSSLDHH